MSKVLLKHTAALPRWIKVSNFLAVSMTGGVVFITLPDDAMFIQSVVYIASCMVTVDMLHFRFIGRRYLMQHIKNIIEENEQ